MQKNIGSYDKMIRAVLGLFLVSLVFWGPETQWGYIGLVLLGTSLVNFCPLYSLIGINTGA